ncbi:hypothetical protein NDU88_005899 [Pleurodeles waltl]|uniref:Mitochondrial glutathione transporter SLC25A40 n=2 Tax=Pleurodeles waltl TaxID=8319 RepID=A0AAV7MCC7_PLEWA|nr:hypothetical protein NDU88_005899 [Pleurodeles waltl]
METDELDIEPHRITAFQQIIASSAGALLTSLIVAPLDVVKIRLQAQTKPFTKGKCFVYCNGLMDHLCICDNGNSRIWYKAPSRFSGTMDAFVQIIRNEGVKALWGGLPPTLVMAVPATAIYFTCYDQLREIFSNTIIKDASIAALVAGGVARFGAVSVISPLELIRTKQQFRPRSYKALLHNIHGDIAKNGWRSLWKGWGATVLRDVPFSAIYWYNYEHGKNVLCQTFNTQEPTFLISFVAGAVSGSIAAVMTLPFDVVKTRRQIEVGEYEVFRSSQKKSASTWRAINGIIAENGFHGLFAGLIPRLIKVVPACAIMISSYELGKSFFRKLNREQDLRTS